MDTDRFALERAVAAHRAGRLVEAEVLYTQFLGAFPDHPGANHNFGTLFAQKGRPDLGLPYIKRATELAPLQVYHWITYAEMLCSAGQVDHARQVLETAWAHGLRGPALQKALAQLARVTSSEAGAWLEKGIRHHQEGRFQEAAEAYRKVLAIQPGLAEVQCNFGSALEAVGEHWQAKAAFEQALSIAPNLASAHFNLGNLYRKQRQWNDAASCYRRALDADPKSAQGYNNLGLVLLETGKPEDAIECFRQAVRLKVPFSSAYANLGNALRLAGRLEEARAAFDSALLQDSDSAEAYNGLGSVLCDQNKHRDAEQNFRRAVSLQPAYVEARDNLANLLSGIGDEAALKEAIAHYERILGIDPDYLAAYDHLGVALCKSHRLAAAFACFTGGAQKRHAVMPTTESPHKARHDQEQWAYRASLGLKPEGALDLRGGEALPGSAVNPAAASGVAEKWLSSRPQIVTVDNFLTDEALLALRRFCLVSTVWKESFEDGYLGARPESGFASPLLAQVAEELRAIYPAIFRDYPLLYAWSFKYDNRLKGTKIHADFAAVNVNFWITPTAANLDSSRGGLVIWDVAAPLDWDFERYNRDERSIRKFLQEQGATAVRIPYRANRAVIFDSDLFHETDEMDFADGYENRRINITLLYGDRKGAAD